MKYSDITIRSITDSDYEIWSKLYLQYADFYKVAYSDEMLKRLWSWLADSNKNIYVKLAIVDSSAQGFVHYRTFIRPLSASVEVFMDDLFVNEQYRKLGVGKELINSVREFAKQNNYSLVRWITAKDNLEAKKLYEKIAKETAWLTYDLRIE